MWGGKKCAVLARESQTFHWNELDSRRNGPFSSRFHVILHDRWRFDRVGLYGMLTMWFLDTNVGACQKDSQVRHREAYDQP